LAHGQQAIPKSRQGRQHRGGLDEVEAVHATTFARPAVVFFPFFTIADGSIHGAATRTVLKLG